MNQHRRNKSETDLNLGNQRTFGNSKFYDSLDQSRKSIDKSPDAAEAKLITAFFNQSELYRDECLDDQALEGTYFWIFLWKNLVKKNYNFAGFW